MLFAETRDMVFRWVLQLLSTADAASPDGRHLIAGPGPDGAYCDMADIRTAVAAYPSPAPRPSGTGLWVQGEPRAAATADATSAGRFPRDIR